MMWGVYCERLGGWLYDTSNVWGWLAAACNEFTSKDEALAAIHAMIENGHTDLSHYLFSTPRPTADVLIVRIS